MNEENLEKLGETADQIENILAATNIPMPAQFHLEQFKSILPDIMESLREIYKSESGENPWETSEE